MLKYPGNLLHKGVPTYENHPLYRNPVHVGIPLHLGFQPSCGNTLEILFIRVFLFIWDPLSCGNPFHKIIICVAVPFFFVSTFIHTSTQTIAPISPSWNYDS